MEEITYMNAPGATVTSTRIAIGAQTFATRNVGSVAIQALHDAIVQAISAR